MSPGLHFSQMQYGLQDDDAIQSIPDTQMLQAFLFLEARREEGRSRMPTLVSFLDNPSTLDFRVVASTPSISFSLPFDLP